MVDKEYESMIQALKLISNSINDVTRSYIRYNTLSAIENVAKILGSVTQDIPTKELKELTKHQATTLKKLAHNFQISDDKILDLARIQIDTIQKIELSTSTLMLDTIRDAMINSNLSQSLNAISTALSKPLIDAADINFIKTSLLANSLTPDIKLPRGMTTALEKLNVSSASRIAKCEDISYEVATSRFIDEKKPDIKADSNELNVICSAADLFDDVGDEYISETELMNFMTTLQAKPGFASENIVGRKIKNIVENIATRINFDEPFFYHARALDPNSCPYDFSQMLTAPSGLTGPGRYNHAGQAFYYIANTKEGAINEVRKHSHGQNIQVAKIKPIKHIEMIDLSGVLKRGATFLRYIRFPAEGIVPRAYLIPCFVSDCCRECNIEGIKYYGSKSYMNYVCWNSGYFQFVEMLE